MDPRISFSNDFVDTQYASKYEMSSYREQPVSSTDFEFSVNNYSMIPADEIFFKGMLLPLKKENCTGRKLTTTLRDELLNVDDDVGMLPAKTNSSAGWWKLGLKKGHISNVPKKVDHTSHEVLGRFVEDDHHRKNMPLFVHEEGSLATKRIKEVLNAD